MASSGVAPDLSDEELRELTAFREREISSLIRDKKRPEAIRLIRDRLAAEQRAAMRFELLRVASVILLSEGKEDEALQAGLERISLAPDDPLGWCGIASLYQCSRGFGAGDPNARQRAIEALDTAVTKARACGAYLRYCLNDRCRLAIELGRWDLLKDSMRQILAMPLAIGAQDIWPEGDFLKRVPADAIGPQPLADYRSLLADFHARKRAAGFDSAADFWCRPQADDDANGEGTGAAAQD